MSDAEGLLGLLYSLLIAIAVCVIVEQTNSRFK